ncbi:MAG: aminoacyl-tRNA hydrolase [Proteobacteria bacterium]|nr:aminoacyl-tRNA hydrolase [Pseudomonadota bacterium]
MHLVAGLGNPGPRYRKNRHNVGFMAVDVLARRFSTGSFKAKWNAEFSRQRMRDQDVVLLKPMTYMNLSGEAIQRALHFFRVRLDRLIVVHDELDLEFATLRFKIGGGSAGHKGIDSVVLHAGSRDFPRLRIGIGRPRAGSAEQHVLTDFNSEEHAALPSVLAQAADALECVVCEGPQAAMNRYNTRARFAES